jgi:hypothetical protein
MISASGPSPANSPSIAAPELQLSLTHMPLAFTANHGQWPDSILFRTRSGGATLWFTRSGAYYQFRGRMPGASKTDVVVSDRIKVLYDGANPSPAVRGDGKLGYRCNFFKGDDPDGWHTDVPSYAAVIYENLYPGIDLKYYGRDGKLEYDFIISPGSDASQIRIRYEGPRSICVTPDGDLIVETGLATVTEQAPYAYQLLDDVVSPVAATYAIVDAHTFGFQLPPNVAAGAPLVIDPVLTFSTYLGGASFDWPAGIAVDGSGSAYVVGQTESSDFDTLNPYQTDLADEDAFVTKFSPDGDSLIYSTYLGGSTPNGAARDSASDIAVDSDGHAYVVGLTNSTDFPTQNAFQTDQGTVDAFVCKLAPAGNALVYSTYVGGGGYDAGVGIAVDSSGCAYVTGQTFSGNFPLENPYQATLPGFSAVFVSKLSPAGDSLRYSTYIGGDDDDLGYAIAVNADLNAYVTGRTSSTDFPTVNPYQAFPGGGGLFENDVFVVRLAPTGDSLVYSTYIGGANSESGEGIGVDDSGHAYIAGGTASPDFPMQVPYDSAFDTGECFVTKLAPTGDSLVYSTFLGGSGGDVGKGIAVDGIGHAYVTGYTNSGDFPILAAVQDSLAGGSDVFVTQFSPAGDGLVFSTFLGSTGGDRVTDIAVEAGSVYITGHTGSLNGFPTENPYQETSDGSFDGYVAKMGCPIALTGDVNLSGAITSADIIYMVNYVFKSDLDPMPCPAAGDVNCSNSTTSADIIYLVNFVFKSDLPPCDACASALAADC